MARSISDNQILEAALTVMANHGYAGATTRQIAAAAGINEVTLFRRFGTKHKILEAIVEQEREHFITAGIEYTGDVEGDLLRIVHFYHQLVQHHGRMITLLLTEIPRQPELLDLLRTPLLIVGKISAVLEQYQQEGILVKERPMQTLVALVGPLFMEGMMSVIRPDVFGHSFDSVEHVHRYMHGRYLG